MNMNLGTYISKKGNLVLYSRHDGGGNVHIEKDDVAEVILWLASFQQGVQPTAFGAGWRGRLANYLIYWAARLAKHGGK